MPNTNMDYSAYNAARAPYERAQELMGKPFEYGGRAIAMLLNEGAQGMDVLTGRRPPFGPPPAVFGQTQPFAPQFAYNKPVIAPQPTFMQPETHPVFNLLTPQNMLQNAAMLGGGAVMEGANVATDRSALAWNKLQEMMNHPTVGPKVKSMLPDILMGKTPEEVATAAETKDMSVLLKEAKGGEAAYQAGLRDKAKGLTESDNPYELGSYEYDQWNRAFVPEPEPPPMSPEILARLRKKTKEVFTDEPGPPEE